MKRLPLLLSALFFTALIGCSDRTQGSDLVKGDSKSTGKKGELLFFINPSGYPCRTQNDIIRSILPKIKDRTRLVYVRTDVAADKSVFYQYGVRSLPYLILLNSDGSISKRFSPGIHEKEDIIEAVKGMKR